MNYESLALPSFWDAFDKLPKEIQLIAYKQYSVFKTNPIHPSIQLKPVGVFWSVRITQNYRALALKEGNTFSWFWIGNHDDYLRLLKK